MGKTRAFLLLVLVMCYALVATVGGAEYEERRGSREREEGEGETRNQGDSWFLLRDSRHVVQTDAGDMRVLRGSRGRISERTMHIGFITMEPNSLFIPQYLDSSLILFIRRGEARIGSIDKDELVEQRLTTGDVYRIAAGSAFYLVNTAEGQRLHVICTIDTSEGLGWHAFQSFFIGGGQYPTSLLNGFGPQTLSTAFNVSTSEIREILTRQRSGPIVYLSGSHHPPSVWTKFLELEQHQRLAHLKRIMHSEEATSHEDQDDKPTWSFRKLLVSVFGNQENTKSEDESESPDPYNLYNKSPDFENNYGSSIALDQSDYSPLRRSDIGIYLVNLTAGSMMAPHINPTATEYGIVLSGSGNIQIVYPNGTLAMNASVNEGDVFMVPRYFPFCQIASRSGPFEFFGFTTSSRRNRPQFLVGRNSLLQSMQGPEFAAAFGVSEQQLRRIIDAQREAVILPSPNAARPDQTMRLQKEVLIARKAEMIPKVIKSFGNDMVMGFD